MRELGSRYSVCLMDLCSRYRVFVRYLGSRYIDCEGTRQ